MNALFGKPFEHRNDRYYLFDRKQRTYVLTPEQFRKSWMRIFCLMNLQGLGILVWYVWAHLIWAQPRLDPSVALIPGGFTLESLPGWFWNPAAMFALLFLYWTLTWRFSVTTWRSLSVLTEAKSRHGVAGKPSWVVMGTKPKSVAVVALITGVFLAVAFAIR